MTEVILGSGEATQPAENAKTTTAIKAQCRPRPPPPSRNPTLRLLRPIGGGLAVHLLKCVGLANELDGDRKGEAPPATRREVQGASGWPFATTKDHN
ncbi:hypothetical protein ACH4FX_11195 [Streptomyces sp. NPDC018019]|uniref:hypothetical protein n=1 Tax=Streptomyces sp. NPDC018019 TaxID=3365030 RepID=UPI003790AFCD